MEIYKINNVNEFLKQGRTNPSEIQGLKATIENYINSYFTPTVQLRLDMDLNLLVNPNGYKAVLFDEMAFLKPLAKLLDINTTSVSTEELPKHISVRAENELSELGLVKMEELLVIKFPTLSGIYQTKKDHIAKSVELEIECQRIKPSTQAELVKAKKLKEYGISRNEHLSNLVEYHTFSFESFMNTYKTDLERLVRYLDFVKANISQAAMPVSLMESLDEDKMDAFINGLKQNQRGLK